MKIAQVNVYFYPAMVGGAEWYVFNISKELVKRGHEVHVYTVDRLNDEKIGPSEELIEGIVVHRLPLVIDLSYRTKIWKGLRDNLISNGYDMIHTYDYGQYHTYQAIKSAKEINVPAIMTIFDIHSLIPRRFYKQIPIQLFDIFFAKYSLNKADKILVRAPNLVDSLLKMGTKPDKIIVTPSGILDKSLEPADGSIFLSEYSIQGKPVILYLGRINPLKGPQILLKAAPEILKHFNSTNFVFVGPDQSGYKKDLVSLSKELGIEDKVVFTGPIYDFDSKMQAYASCDVFTLPSSYEGTSQAIFEAMSQSRPIVATKKGGIPFQVTNEKEARLVDYNDPEYFKKTILMLLTNKKLAKDLGSNAYEKVKNFTYSKLAKQIEQIYTDEMEKR
jgi:glycosyltransferase involved in cell wall biosynthesis